MSKAYFICGTHWDREWYEPFQEYRSWLVHTLDSVLDRMKQDPTLGVFHLDGQTVVIEDYLEIQPQRRSEITELLSSGRLVAGPWYAMPDLWLVSGEALIRNLTRGMRLARNFGGVSAKVGYTPDLFGHIAAMPMIFTGLGLTSAVVWRGVNDAQVRSQFIWVGPDGSRLLTHKLPNNAGYGWLGAMVRWPWTNADFDTAAIAESFAPIIRAEIQRGDVPVIYLSDASDHQFMPQRLTEMLDMFRTLCPDIEFVQGTMDEYFADVTRHVNFGKLAEFHGELRYPAWQTGTLYHALIPHCLASRYPLKQANDRVQNLLTLWSEPLSAMTMLAGKEPAPPGFLDLAWKHLLLNQPHDSICGCSIDDTHADMPYRFRQAEQLGDIVRRRAQAQLSSTTDKQEHANHIVVWNPLPWERKEVVEIELPFSSEFAAKAMRSGHNWPVLNQFDLVDAHGRLNPYQVLEVKPSRIVKMPDDRGRRLRVGDKLDVYRVAVQLDLPAAGYTSITVRPLEGVGRLKRQLGTLRTAPLSARNEHMSISIMPHGAVELIHLATGKVYRDLFQYEDSGDTGDGWNFIPPMNNPIVVSPGHAAQVFVEEDGPLQITFRIERVLRVPAGIEPVARESRLTELVKMSITDYLTVRVGDPRLHVRTVVNNTAGDHRLRVLLPTDITMAKDYWSDQPFAWVRRSIATDPKSVEYKEPDPAERPHHTIVAVGDAMGGLAVLCPEAMHEHTVCDDTRRTLALTLFRATGKAFFTDGEPAGQSLGAMEFSYALQPFAGELSHGELSRSVMELQAGISSHISSLAKPEHRSFFKIDANQSVVMTALKPATEGHAVIVRLWNTSKNAETALIRLTASPHAVWLCDLKEDSQQPLKYASDGSVAVIVPPLGLSTVRIATMR